jgi:hypothetical protein
MLQQLLQFGEHLPAVAADQNIRVACKNREQTRQRFETLFQQVATFCFLNEEKKRVLRRMGGCFVPFRATRQQIARSIN